jgi:ABC-type transporter Mla subunit MlaD
MERRLTAGINHAKEEIMSNLDDSTSRVSQAVTDAAAAIQTEVQQLRDALANTASPEQLQRLDDASARLEQATADLGADDTPPPAAPGA